MKLDLNGEVVWAKDFGNYAGGVNQFDGLKQGNWALVFTECWGIAPIYAEDGTTHDGYVMACGTGTDSYGGC